MNLHTPCNVSLASNEVRYRSAHPTDLQNSYAPPNSCASEQRAAAASNAGGDDPIRTDGAFRGHSALAVRRLRALGYVSMNRLVGMERFELSCTKALVSKTSVSSISTTSPLVTNCNQPGHTSSRLRKKLQTASEVPTRAKAPNFVAQCLSGFENPLPRTKSPGLHPGQRFSAAC